MVAPACEAFLASSGVEKGHSHHISVLNFVSPAFPINNGVARTEFCTPLAFGRFFVTFHSPYLARSAPCLDLGFPGSGPLLIARTAS
jgi:hypothetical protein